MPLAELNRRLAPLARRLFRVRSRAGTVCYALGPGFDYDWPTYGAALADLSLLPAVQAPAPLPVAQLWGPCWLTPGVWVPEGSRVNAAFAAPAQLAAYLRAAAPECPAD